MFGTDDFDENLANLTGIDRDDAITEKYCSCLSQFCRFRYVLRASVLHPDQDRLYFQLIYATRHVKGVEVFKKSEAKAMESQEKQRALVEERRKSTGGQRSLLDPDDMPESRFYLHLRSRYLDQARHCVVSAINSAQHVLYDEIWLTALSFPMVWERDLRQWLDGWFKQGMIELRGLRQQEKTVKRGKGHLVIRKIQRIS